MKQKWQNLSSRDQRALSIGGIIAAGIIFYLWIWSPLSTRIDSLRTQVTHQQQLLQSLQQAQQIVHHLAPRMAFSSELFNRALLQASLQKFQLDSTLVNLTSESNQHYNLVIKNASFDHLMACLIELSEQYDVQVMQANLTTTGAGLVSGEMVLQGH